MERGRQQRCAEADDLELHALVIDPEEEISMKIMMLAGRYEVT